MEESCVECDRGAAAAAVAAAMVVVAVAAVASSTVGRSGCAGAHGSQAAYRAGGSRKEPGHPTNPQPVARASHWVG